MSDYKRPQPGQECPPAPTHPADQPYPPGGGGDCKDLPTTTPPTLEKPTACPEPDPPCKCPPRPGSSPTCLEDLIAKQAAEIAAADKAKAFKTDLEALLAKAKAASQQYTKTKYDDLVKEWVRQDVAIAELIRKVVCAVPCWRCVIECHVCPLLNELHYAEEWLYDDGKQYADVHDLYDLQYWYTRDREAKERRYLRIKAVLAAWEKPAATIEKVLGDDWTLAEAIGKALGTDAGKAVYDLFLRLVPRHLAIAPPRGSAWTTRIDEEYTFESFCGCDKPGDSDHCCGPELGPWSLRQRVIGPQPNLIDPNDYLALICCLVEKRYGPAKDALSKAEADIVKVNDQIARYKAQLENGLKNFDADAKAAIPSVVDCCDYEPDETEAKSSYRAR